MGLGGMVVMMGVMDITAEAGMGALSRSRLGLEGSSVDSRKTIKPQYILDNN